MNQMYDEKLSRYCELVIRVDQLTKSYKYSVKDRNKIAKHLGYMPDFDKEYISDRLSDLNKAQSELKELISELFAPSLFVIKMKKTKKIKIK